jgi:hypothetical protein
MVSIAGLNKAEVLAALYNTARPQGMGFLHYDPAPMTTEVAQAILDLGVTSFDYLKGRVMKVDLSGDDVDPWGFDRDNGHGVVEAVVHTLRQGGGPNNPLLQVLHEANTQDAVEEAKGMVENRRPSSTRREGGVVTIELGLDDELADALGSSLQGR